jgi:hypothetical protein
MPRADPFESETDAGGTGADDAYVAFDQRVIRQRARVGMQWSLKELSCFRSRQNPTAEVHRVLAIEVAAHADSMRRLSSGFDRRAAGPRARRI